jgi:soluble lytic murein transglycosylase-like protein
VEIAVTHLDLACARSLRRASARRETAARRVARARFVLRTLAVANLTCLAVLARPAPVEPMTVHAQPSASPSAAGTSSCGIPQRFVAAFRAASEETGLPLSLLSAVAWEESRMNPHALSTAGARGLLQVLPATAQTVFVTEDGPRANVLAGARYLLWLVERYGGKLELALSAYNAGPTAVDRAGGAPTIETLRYAKNVEARADALSRCA